MMDSWHKKIFFERTYGTQLDEKVISAIPSTRYCFHYIDYTEGCRNVSETCHNNEYLLASKVLFVIKFTVHYVRKSDQLCIDKMKIILRVK